MEATRPPRRALFGEALELENHAKTRDRPDMAALYHEKAAGNAERIVKHLASRPHLNEPLSSFREGMCIAIRNYTEAALKYAEFDLKASLRSINKALELVGAYEFSAITRDEMRTLRAMFNTSAAINRKNLNERIGKLAQSKRT